MNQINTETRPPKITKDEILDLVEEIKVPSYIAEHAARAAAEQLAENWASAINDNHPGDFITEDISQLKSLLDGLVVAVRERLKLIEVPTEA